MTNVVPSLLCQRNETRTHVRIHRDVWMLRPLQAQSRVPCFTYVKSRLGFVESIMLTFTVNVLAPMLVVGGYLMCALKNSHHFPLDFSEPVGFLLCLVPTRSRSINLV